MVTATMVNDLRKKTGIGMMACKKALDEAGGDEEKAIEILRKKGASKAMEKSGRETGEGRIFIKSSDEKTAIVKISCETDFVAKNENFTQFADSIVDTALASGEEEAMKKGLAEVSDLIGKIGENIKIENIKIIEAKVSGSYIHSNGKIGVVVSLSGGTEDIAKDIAMHAAAMNPSYTDPSEVSDSLIEKEKDIWTVQLKNEGKPENIISNILIGKEKKFRAESALKTQVFVKDNSKTCEAYAKEAGAEILGFVRVAI